jgi:two-component system, response regulator YcbB
LRYFIVDDDMASRMMLKKIITDGELGVVVGEAESGMSSLSSIITMHPDVVLIDLLMPGLDGIETIEQLRSEGFEGSFIMISQIVNKEMVGEAYEKGVEYFIHKPINRVEVQTILKKSAEQAQLRNSLLSIRESLANIGMNSNQTMKKQKSVREIVLSILNDMGIIGGGGSDDIVWMIELMMSNSEKSTQMPALKDLYEAVASKIEFNQVDIKKESKAIEQRIRRTILTAFNNLVSLGSIDYTNPEFEYYAPRYFDFQEVRKHMVQIQEDIIDSAKVKINIKKFLHVLYLETVEKYNQG